MTEEREIDLKQLLLVVLMHKNLIALAAVICCIAGVIYGAMKAPKPVAAPAGEEPDQHTQETVETYLSDKHVYDVQKNALERQITELSDLLGGVETYLRESPAMTIDPYRATTASAELYVIREDTAELAADGTFSLPTETNRILNAYSMSVTREIGSLEAVAEALDTKTIYLKDLVYCSIDYRAASLVITVTGPEKVFADKLLDGVLGKIERVQSDIKSRYGDHETMLVRHAPVEEPNTTLLSGQQTALNAVTDYANRITNAKAALDKLTEPEVPGGIEVSEVPDGETTAEAVMISGGGISPKQLVKFGGIGFAGGLFASMFFVALYYILTNRVLSADEFNNRYRMRAITMLPGTKQAGAKRRMAMRGRDSAFLRMSEEEQYEVAATNLSVYAPDVKDIILTGSIPAPRLQKLAETLTQRIDGVRFAAASNINEDAQALQALKEHEHVIVVEECLASNYSETDRAYQTLRDWDKKVIGSIVLG
ncbi:MAG: hypothetical protein IJQ21_04680 [Lachnospiraceae bacterium]|nr:hypothetical protein [Lachnospiraceae bacterium]